MITRPYTCFKVICAFNQFKYSYQCRMNVDMFVLLQFSIIRLSVTAGKHHLYHVDPSMKFSVIVYGFDSQESYGFPLGLSNKGKTIYIAMLCHKL